MTILATALTGDEVNPGGWVNVDVKGMDLAGNVLSSTAGHRLQGLHIDLAQQGLEVLFFVFATP